MAQCAQCQKTFKTKNTLARHLRNHVRDQTHHLRCHICDVGFARRDILNRHQRNSHTDDVRSDLARSRCHTACEPCRTSRTRCNGRNPCLTCVRNSKDCVYATASRRVSRPVRSGLCDEVAGDNPLSPALNLNEPPSSRPTDGALVPAPAMVQQSATASAEDMFFSRPAWPWLHETYFLDDSNNADLDWSSLGSFWEAPQQMDVDPQSLPTDTSFEPSDERSSLLDVEFNSDVNSLRTDQPTSRKRTDTLSIHSIAENLVKIATGAAFSHEPDDFASNEWFSLTIQLADTLGIKTRHGETVSTAPDRILQHFAHEFLNNFNPLWPMFSEWRWEEQSFHPILLLTISSIGAMYGSHEERSFGTSMHERLRRLLAAALFDLEGPDDDLIWLAQARVLTQVHALYFGQRQGFSYAQHLGSILVAQARRMNIFDEGFPPRWSSLSAVERCSRWTALEGRRRLAFGVMRADVFTSVLLDSRPFLSPLEIKLTVPRAAEVWHNSAQLSDEELVVAQQVEEKRLSRRYICDLVSIALHQADCLPILDAASFEMLMFGLQDSIWRFAHDPNLFTRLTGESGAMPISSAALKSADRARAGNKNSWRDIGQHQPRPLPSESGNSDELERRNDRIGLITRPMESLKDECNRLVGALADWMAKFDAARVDSQFVYSRDTLMSSLLLYDLSRLRLSAPLQDLHQVAYGQPDVTLESTVLDQIRLWTETTSAVDARRSANNILSLIEHELQRPPLSRARFNLLAFCSLHHGAVVVWTLENAERQKTQAHPFDSGGNDQFPADTLRKCAHLFDGLTPLGGSSFKQAALRLSQHTFPDLSRRD